LRNYSEILLGYVGAYLNYVLMYCLVTIAPVDRMRGVTRARFRGPVDRLMNAIRSLMNACEDPAGPECDVLVIQRVTRDSALDLFDVEEDLATTLTLYEEQMERFGSRERLGMKVLSAVLWGTAGVQLIGSLRALLERVLIRRMLPGGSLAASQGAVVFGGKGIAHPLKHVLPSGTTVGEYGRSLLSASDAPAVSVLTASRHALEVSVARAIRANKDFIRKALEVSGTKTVALQKYDAGKTLGVVIERGTGREVPSSVLEVVIRKNDAFAVGFHIHTIKVLR
jgi:hypothetical protein